MIMTRENVVIVRLFFQFSFENIFFEYLIKRIVSPTINATIAVRDSEVISPLKIVISANASAVSVFLFL